MKVMKNILSVILMILWIMLVWQGIVRSYKPDLMLLWIIAGLPFGICKMFVVLIPGKHDIATDLGIILINVVLGGIIGGVVLVSKIIRNLSGIIMVRAYDNLS